MQSALLHFESAAFGIDPGEDEATNPGIFGRALAEWVRDRLRERGLPAEDVIAEDFGWCVPVRLESHAVYVAFLGKDTRREAMDRVFGAVREALASSPGITNLTEETAQP
jgi:hypothetical protein